MTDLQPISSAPRRPVDQCGAFSANAVSAAGIERHALLKTELAPAPLKKLVVARATCRIHHNRGVGLVGQTRNREAVIWRRSARDQPNFGTAGGRPSDPIFKPSSQN